MTGGEQRKRKETTCVKFPPHEFQIIDSSIVAFLHAFAVNKEAFFSFLSVHIFLELISVRISLSLSLPDLGQREI